jgi:hypothetical protein
MHTETVGLALAAVAIALLAVIWGVLLIRALHALLRRAWPGVEVLLALGVAIGVLRPASSRRRRVTPRAA